MIGLDSNVVLRLLVEDDVEQTATVRNLALRALTQHARMFVSAIVLCETVWVLVSCYHFARTQVADAISTLLTSPELQVEHAAEVRAALDAFCVGAGDFSDYLIRERALVSGSQSVATFDRPLLKEPGFVHPDPKRWPDDLSLHEDTPRYGARRRRVRT